MKIKEVKQFYSSQINALWTRKLELAKILEEDSKGKTQGPRYDRVQLSRELAQVEKEYEDMEGFMEQQLLAGMNQRNAEVAKQQGEVMAEAAEDMAKCLEIARRISKGAKVPAIDEKKLMEYSHELYMAAKNMGLMKAHKEPREYGALFDDDEGGQADLKAADEIEGNAETAAELPETPPECGEAELDA